MNNDEFLDVLSAAYKKYLETHRRSNQKLKILHKAVAEDLQHLLGADYQLKSYGIGNDKEGKIKGRYMEKSVDIAIYKSSGEIGGIALKFIMSNYSQNSNNYFESMLGETANIRSNQKAYFQIVVLAQHLPYFGERAGVKDCITKIETVTSHNIDKYIKLSNDNPGDFLHTPIKTLLYLVKTPDISHLIGQERAEWIKYLSGLNPFTITASETPFAFGSSAIYNDYQDFINKVSHYCKSI